MTAPRLYVDGDACPVKAEVLKVAGRHGLEVFMVSNTWLRQAVGPRVQAIVVPEGPDAADDWIEEHIAAGDIAITADIPLAARCLAKGASALSPTGKPFTDDSIGMALAMRDLKAELRETGEIKGYVPAFTKKDRSRFLEALEREIQAEKRKRA